MRVSLWGHQVPSAKGVGCWPTMPEAWQGQAFLGGPPRAPAALRSLLLVSSSQCDAANLRGLLPALKTRHPRNGRCVRRTGHLPRPGRDPVCTQSNLFNSRGRKGLRNSFYEGHQEFEGVTASAGAAGDARWGRQCPGGSRPTLGTGTANSEVGELWFLPCGQSTS